MYACIWASQVTLVAKKPPAGGMRDTGRPLGQEGPREEGMATHSNVLAWRTPQTEELGGLLSTGSPRIGHN